MADDMRWVYLITAPDETTAEMWRGVLEDSGIPAIIQPGDRATYLGTSTLPCRVMVPEPYRTEAVRVMEELLGREL